MDEHTTRLLAMLERQFEQFRNRQVSLEEVQAASALIAQSFERGSGADLSASMSRLAGALEHIRWMSLPEEQFLEAVKKIQEFEEMILRVQDGEEQ